jgi:hypothetical protein
VSHPAPYTYEPRREWPRGQLPPDVVDTEAIRLASTGAPSSLVATESSIGSGPTWAPPRKETIACIRENVCEHLKNGPHNKAREEYLSKLAEPLYKVSKTVIFKPISSYALMTFGAQLPEPERWPAQVFMTLVANTQRVAPNQSTDTTPDSKQSSKSPPPTLKSFVQTNIRQILLGSDVDCYNRRGSRKNHETQTPFTLMKVSLSCHR